MLYFAAINTGNYRWFSRVYDGLARLGVPGGVWRRSHQELLHHVPKQGVIWVIGTGTGEALKAMHNDLQIVSIDASIDMERRARRALSDRNVQFVNAAFQELDMTGLPIPNAIVFPYLLQLVEPAAWLEFERKLKALGPSKHPRLFVLDFVHLPHPRVWQRLYTALLLSFYAWASGQRVHQLNDWFATLESTGYHTLSRQTWLQGLVEFRLLSKK
jgi:ubiquinone/menaquinone biosynthesis C-methylase UbiE